MLQELAAETAATGWAIASMVFFGAIWLGIAVWVFRTSPEQFESRARLALEGDAEDRQNAPPVTQAER
jgi:cbb3-type cytochrome oxidase subunit 3